jgi:hypothetical protein
MFKKVKDNLPDYHKSKLTAPESVNMRLTRQTADAYIHTIRKDIEKQTLNYKVGHAWNTLPISVKETNMSIHSFSRRLKKHLLNEYNTSCSVVDCYICKK